MTTINKSNINEIAQVIADIVSNQYDSVHGIRVICEDYNNYSTLTEGEWVEPSHDWDFENDMSLDDVMEGCSTIAINDSDDAEWIAEKIIASAKRYGYGCESKLVLVSGKDMGYGTDDGELLIDGLATKIYNIDSDLK